MKCTHYLKDVLLILIQTQQKQKQKHKKLLLSFNPEKKLSRMLDKFAGQEDLIEIFKKKRRNITKLTESHP